MTSLSAYPFTELARDWIFHFPDTFRHWYWPQSHPQGAAETPDGSAPFGLSLLVSDSVGIALTLAGAFCTSFGSIWETYDATHGGPELTETGYMSLIPSNTAKNHWIAPFLDLKVLFGIFVWLFGATLHVLGLLFAPASLLGPVNSAGLVFTLWLSWALLEDEISWEMIASSAGIVMGIAICLWASTSSAPMNTTLREKEMMIISSWSDRTYIFFCGFIVCVVALASWGIYQNNKKRAEAEQALFELSPQYSLDTYLGRRFLSSDAGRKLRAKKVESEKRSETAGMLLALLGGVCGSQTVCQIKEVEAFWTMTEFEGYGFLVCPQALWALLLLLVTATVQFPLISSAYQLADHPTVSALYHVTWTVFSVIGGFVKFKEYKGLSESAIRSFAFGLLLTLLATYLAARRSVAGVVAVIGPTILKEKGSILSTLSVAPFWPRFGSTNPAERPTEEPAVELTTGGKIGRGHNSRSLERVF